jgi:hypothetical protein
VPSACFWANDSAGIADIQYQAIISRAVRCHDPFVELRGHWIVRRLAPDCSRIELAALPVVRDELKLLEAMGWETANIHLGTNGAAGRIRRHLERQRGRWFSAAAKQGTAAVKEDWHAWKKAQA